MSTSKNPENHLELSSIRDIFVLDEEQQDIFIDTPIEIVDMIHFKSGTVQASYIALAKDGGEYVLKGSNDGNDSDIQQIEEQVQRKILKEMSPVSELFCYKIASLCGLPTPQYRILIDSENNLYFGSNIDQGHSSKNEVELKKIFFTPTGITNLFFSQLWTIYAFDCFFFNIDRHLGNYLILKSNNFNYTQLKPFDFGFSSFSFVGYPYDGPYISSTNCNTKRIMKIVDEQLIKNSSEYRNNRHSYIEVAKNQLDKLLNISSNKIKEIMYSIPSQWMKQDEKDKFITWWNSEEKLKRINNIKVMELV
ncbi:hypothetical protein [Gallibacterium anatis]|uniref:hypothetical protein n=1 Tax=Gallibacterium anatis TaxID=750 RepID=UPI000BA02B54|nr:hypothetical protein [Gallibacterium anatis]OZN49393.1 hypothetical protein CF595_05370 [Gallibacterium anatis]